MLDNNYLLRQINCLIFIGRNNYIGLKQKLITPPKEHRNCPIVTNHKQNNAFVFQSQQLYCIV